MSNGILNYLTPRQWDALEDLSGDNSRAVFLVLASILKLVPEPENDRTFQTPEGEFAVPGTVVSVIQQRLQQEIPKGGTKIPIIQLLRALSREAMPSTLPLRSAKHIVETLLGEKEEVWRQEDARLALAKGPTFRIFPRPPGSGLCIN